MDDIYKEKLKYFLRGLQCQNIDELMEKSPEYFYFFGFHFANAFIEKIVDNAHLKKPVKS